MKFFKSCLLIFASHHLTIVWAEPSILIDKTGVTYRGTVSDSVEQFQNIKYAHDTSGERRFAPLEPYDPLGNTIIDAKNPGPSCPQHQVAMPPYFSETTEMSEDCLHLRIARPEGLNLTQESKIPVVVWIHGGGVVKGSAYDPHTDPHNLVKLSLMDGKPIIFAAINYRLTIFGFARLPLLKDQKSLNVGMRDQRLGLEWIQAHFQDFGGDPDRITVYGLSAGATSISLQTMVYGGEKGVPFQQAWVMSGPPGTSLNMTSRVTALHTAAVGKEAGCAELPDLKLVECLRAVPMQELLHAALQYSVSNFPPAGLFTFVPSVDDDFLPDSPSKLVRAGRFVKGIRMVLGWTQEDGATNAGPGHLIQTEGDIAKALKTFSAALTADQISHLLDLYPVPSFEEELNNYQNRKTPQDPEISVHFFRLSRILRDLLFTCSSINFGYEMSKQTRATLDPNFDAVRLYSLNQSILTPMFHGAGMPYISIPHGSDTNYIFNGLFPEGEVSASDKELSERFSRSFINFAYTGNPIAEDPSKGKGFETWPEAFGNGRDLSKLQSFVIQVIGGPLGTCPVSVMDPEYKAAYENEGWMGELDGQKILEFREMAEPALSSEALRIQVMKEKLLKRCGYIESLSETLGV
ncbi:hypothetical protein HYFRA_00000506 [Hymenoscyphus fraxineus]|uniref:Carboxylic ester hydrolase n=1 Tax=Hymenoscyphus fraxineus TaxID=746836 RepID=A0A9N9L3Z0_9HELO|nr:hypothetical protein HYFRA_00000506 [Hymenoscyphus fraxineus]